MVCRGLGRDLRVGHHQFVRNELPFVNRRLPLAVSTLVTPDSLKTIGQDLWCLEQVRHVCRGNAHGLLLLSHARFCVRINMVFAM